MYFLFEFLVLINNHEHYNQKEEFLSHSHAYKINDLT